jgi:polyhydroxyalkanoate synthesis regulator phasin
MDEKQLLIAIGKLLDERDAKLSKLIDEKFKPIQEDIAGIKSDVTVLKGDVSALKDDVTVLKGDVLALKDDTTKIKSQVNIVYEWVDSIDLKVKKIDDRTA